MDQRQPNRTARPDAPESTMSLSDRLYRTPVIHVAGICAAAGAAFALLLTLILLIFGLRITHDTDALGNEFSYFGLMSNGRPVLGTLYLPEGETGFVFGSTVNLPGKEKYKGEMDGLLFNGEGALTDDEGNTYLGNFVDGFLEGEGTVKYKDGSTFSGTFVNGREDGYGEYVGVDGSSYLGNYKAGEKDGYGVMTYADGSVYKGYFSENMRNGQGTYRFACGDNYTGEFRNNVIWGQGSYFFASGRVFTGEFRNGAPVLE